jgi:prevent-host-death family protein
MEKILPISEVKTHFPALVTRIAARDDQVVVTRKGKPAVVILSYDDYEQLRETLEVLSDPGLMRRIHRSLGYFDRGGAGQTFETVFGEPLHLPSGRRRRP